MHPSDRSEYRRAYRQKNKERIALRERAYQARRKREIASSQLLRRFGISIQQYDAMLKSQGEACAICCKPCTLGRRLAVDHDHATKRVRGLLCFKCNRAIGLLGDSAVAAQRASFYLTRLEV